MLQSRTPRQRQLQVSLAELRTTQTIVQHVARGAVENEVQQSGRKAQTAKTDCSGVEKDNAPSQPLPALQLFTNC